MSKNRDIADRKVDGVNLTLGDNDKVILGDGSDLQIYHDGYNSYVKDAGTGSLYVQGSHMFLTDADGNEYLRLSDQGAGGTVYIKHNGVTKLTTSSTGVDVNGSVDVSSDVSVGGEINLTSTGANNYIDFASDALHIRPASSTPNYETGIRIAKDGAVDIYHDGVSKLATNASGAKVTTDLEITGHQVMSSVDPYIRRNDDTGHITISGGSGWTTTGAAMVIRGISDGYNAHGAEIRTGDKETLRLDASGDASFYRDVNIGGELNFTAANWNYIDAMDSIDIRSVNGGYESFLRGHVNGAVKLFYDNVEKFTTTADGVHVSGNALNLQAASGIAHLELGGPSGAIIDLKAPFSDDYDGRISHYGEHLYINNTTGGIGLELNGSNRVDIHTNGTNYLKGVNYRPTYAGGNWAWGGDSNGANASGIYFHGDHVASLELRNASGNLGRLVTYNDNRLVLNHENVDYFACVPTSGAISYQTLIAGRLDKTTLGSNNDGTFSVRGDATHPAGMSFHRAGAYAVNFGLDTDNQLKVGGWSMGGPYVVHHDGNTGRCKVWITVNGTSGPASIRNSFGVSSLTDEGTGKYRVNFTNSFGSDDYAAVFGHGNRVGSAYGGNICIADNSQYHNYIYVWSTEANVFYDTLFFNMACFK